jgi:long-subunit acyl-CoA synthetase (AMP-forming)
VKNPKIVADIVRAWNAANKKAVSRASHVRKWLLMTTDFSIPGEELTPTLKLKRKKTYIKYEKEIDGMYLDDPKL